MSKLTAVQKTLSLAIVLAASSFSAQSAVVVLDDFTGSPQSATHRIGGSALETPALAGAFVYSTQATVTTGTAFPVLKRRVAARQSGTTWNNNSSYSANATTKFWDSSDIGALNMGVDALSLGAYGDLQLIEEFTPINVTPTSYVELVIYGICTKTNPLTVTANNGAKATITVQPHVSGVDQVYRIPVSAFNQAGFAPLDSLSSLKLDARAVESTRFSILKISVGGVTAFPASCPTVVYTHGL